MALVVKTPLANSGDVRYAGLSPRLEKSPGRAWQPNLVFLPENPMDRGAWWATVDRVAKSRIQLK